MKTIKSLIFVFLSLCGVELFPSEVTLPAAKRQRVEVVSCVSSTFPMDVDSGDPEFELQKKAKADSGKDKTQELGIQDTLIKFINPDPANIVKAYLGWHKQSYVVSDQLNSTPIRGETRINCLALARDEYNKPLLYIGTTSPESHEQAWIMCPEGEKIDGHVVCNFSETIKCIAPIAANRFIIQSNLYTRSFSKLSSGYWGDSIGGSGSMLPHTFLSVSGNNNKKGKPTFLISRYVSWEQRLGKDLKNKKSPSLMRISPGSLDTSSENIFIFDCLAGISVVGKSKEGDCLGYHIQDNEVFVFDLETGTFKNSFTCIPYISDKDKEYCSANDEGYLALGSAFTDQVYIYDEVGALIKEFMMPQLCSVTLANKGRCIVGDRKGGLRTISIKSDDMYEMGTVPHPKDWWLVTPLLVAIDRQKPTRIAATNKSDTIDIFTDEAEAIEEYDRELKTRGAQ